MRVTYVLWRRELTAYFLSPIAYAFMVFFLAVMGFSFWFLANLLLDGAPGATVLRELYASFFFWLVNLTVVPVITMRVFAEEKREGTIETLMTAPVTDTQVVLSKFIGALTFYMVLWVPTLSYIYILNKFSAQSAQLDAASLASAYGGIFLVGGLFIAVGVFCSALTANQVVAAMMSFSLLTLIFLSGLLSDVSANPLVQQLSRYFSCVFHMEDFTRGILDSRPLVFYLSATLLLLFATVKVVESRKWT